MPIVNGKYKNPGWIDNARPPISAQNLNDISDTLEKLDQGGGGTTGVTSFNGRTGVVNPQSGDYTAAMVGARSSTWLPTPAEINAVPAYRTINGKALTANITLSASDVGTAPITINSTDLTAGSSSLATGAVYLVYE